MENENNYPNGWKDGWSSADHATESYSPYAAERAQRSAMEESEKRDRIMSSYEAGLKKEQEYYEKQQSEQAREEWKNSQIEIEAREQVAQRSEAIRLLVQQKRDDFNQKSSFGKIVATLRGKSFDKMKKQIIAEAERRIDRMNPEQIEHFIENYAEKEGRKR